MLLRANACLWVGAGTTNGTGPFRNFYTKLQCDPALNRIRSDTGVRDLSDAKRCEGPPVSTEYHGINDAACSEAAPPPGAEEQYAALARWCF